MKIVAHVHMAAPQHGAGAEWMLHAIARYLVSRGHDFTVLASQGKQGTSEVDGVEIIGFPSQGQIECAWEWADVAFTHLDLAMDAMRLAVRKRKPLVHLVHNHNQLTFHGVTPEAAQLVVFNSSWLASTCGWWQGDWTIVHPPVEVARYEGCEGGLETTLINLQAAKGALTFYAAARALPDVPFLGVRGAYGPQIEQQSQNVELITNQPDVRRVYERTRVLLMPSGYESWGRCAVEAACSGIPTIYHPTPGLVEAMGPAGMPIHADQTDEIARAIVRCYEDDDYYEERALAARARAQHLERVVDEQLAALELRLHDVAQMTPGESFSPVHPSQQGWHP